MISFNTPVLCLGCVVVDCQSGVLGVQILRLCRGCVCAFCSPNRWARKTGSGLSCSLKTAGQEGIKSTSCCHCLQRLNCESKQIICWKMCHSVPSETTSRSSDYNFNELVKTWWRYSCAFVAVWLAMSRSVPLVILKVLSCWKGGAFLSATIACLELSLWVSVKHPETLWNLTGAK